MKKMVVLLFVVIASHLYAQKIKGSDTVLPLAQKEAEIYMQVSPGILTTVTGGGSGVGILSLLEGTTDIAMSSRSLKYEERLRFKELGREVMETVIAFDALCVIVHPSNRVTALTRQQLEDIFRGKITRWSQVGGENIPVVVYVRETSSGTYEFFKETVLKHKNYMAGALSMPATGTVIQSVSQTRGAIGYVGFPYVNDKVKTLKITQNGKEYPVVRPLLLYYLRPAVSEVQSFVDFVLSDSGQQIAREMGYIEVQHEENR
ncbi:MAG: PstS family phosphate ABC transporter substrate-binding protein [Bacteroidales bacterium]|jgi:phosphate transport system substrate-binding protein|nr:PstS family phosphate ABC transporter substrate-binding protein [Bacteroidales bacterium]MDD4256242.1 PstS family phosphate ABC transporter substrate-binding protein [Bacteroidales bacterium]MDD4653892.1 PstS family phosphate ABC transporter substrate-binding protein [Bacteroidales bacterium]MDD4828198.1 PstS family phosphate ABC transporter substrate-binding protein [Bacteroidales bacterium]